MTPQLVDLNADGYNDMVMGIFDGCVHIVKGSADGFQKPEFVNDKNGDSVKISMYWDFDESTYLHVDRSTEDEAYIKERHLTSAAAVDWDKDGDLDLLLGAYEGALYVCMNEGTKEKPEFSDKNLYVKAGGKHLTLESGLATPHICDWNGDGNFDILCGGSKGGVFYYENTGIEKETGGPVFAKAVALIDPDVGKEPRSTPVFPDHGFHIETADYDQDGDLDLLVGAQTGVLANPKVLTKAEEDELEELDKLIAETQAKMSPLTKDLKTQEDFEKIRENEEYKTLQAKHSSAWKRIAELRPRPETKNIVWLFRNKGAQGLVSKKMEATFTSSANPR